MDYIRVWTEMDIKDVQEHIIMVEDKFGHCPGCKEIGIKLTDLGQCPGCGRDFKFVTSKDARGGKMDVVLRTRKKLPDLTFVDYDDYVSLTGKKKAQDLFKV